MDCCKNGTATLVRHFSTRDCTPFDESSDKRRLLNKGDSYDHSIVCFSITVHNVGALDALNQTFNADVCLHMSWFEPSLENRTLTEEVKHKVHLFAPRCWAHLRRLGVRVISCL